MSTLPWTKNSFATMITNFNGHKISSKNTAKLSQKNIPSHSTYLELVNTLVTLNLECAAKVLYSPGKGKESFNLSPKNPIF